MNLKVILPVLIILLLTSCSGLSFADCTGCCSGHGGVVCSNGVTKCGDGTALSQTCIEKGCIACTATTIPATSTTTTPTTTIQITSTTATPSTTTIFQTTTSTPYTTSTTTNSQTTTSTITRTTTTTTTSSSTITATTFTYQQTTTTRAPSSTTTTTLISSLRLIFPQVADGGGYKTTILLTNKSSFSPSASVYFLNDNGMPMVVGVGQNAGSSFSFQIPSQGSWSLQTTGESQSASTGWALVSIAPSADVNGNAIFQLFNNGTLYSEASVPASSVTSSAEFYADEENGFMTGFAIANPGSVGAIGNITLRTKTGETVGTYPLNIGSNKHLATFLAQIFPGAKTGRAEITFSSGAASITALRFHASSVFSSVSVGQNPISSFFSPNGGVQKRIITEIDKASTSIDIAIYSFTADPIRDALMRAKSRGVSIRLIADLGQSSGQGSEISFLEQQGISVKRMSGESGGIMHNKYMIIDGITLFTGSYNWSANAEENSYENAVFVQGLKTVSEFSADFERLWKK